MVEITDLKGFDFSKKYFNPAKEYSLKTDEYEFISSPKSVFDHEIDLLDYEFKSKLYSKKGSISNIFPFDIIKMELVSMGRVAVKIEYIKKLFSNFNFDVCELYDFLLDVNRMYFYTSWAILINHGINIENISLAKEIIDIFSEYNDIAFENRLMFIEDLFDCYIEDDFTLNDLENFSKDLLLRYSLKFPNQQRFNEILNNPHVLEEKLNKVEEYKKFVNSKLNNLNEELSAFVNMDNVDLISLFEDITCYRGSNEDKYVAYELILKEFDIDDFDKIEDLDKIVRNHNFKIQDTFDFESIKNQNFHEIHDVDFKLAYIQYLQLLNSFHNNLMDKLHYFDNDYNAKVTFLRERSLPEGNYRQISVDFLKEYALRNNHIYDAEGLGILIFKTYIKDIRAVANKYDLGKSRYRQILIDRIIENLSEDEINKEFPGHRFMLTSEGEKLLNDFKHYNFRYFHALPTNFTPKEFIRICEMNSEYCVEDIIFAIVMHEWIVFEDKNLFSESSLREINHNINRPKFDLGSYLMNDFPYKAEQLFVDAINNSTDFNFRYVQCLCDCYHMQDKYNLELDLINSICDNAKKNIINIYGFDSHASDWLDKRKNVLFKHLNKK